MVVVGEGGGCDTPMHTMDDITENIVTLCRLGWMIYDK